MIIVILVEPENPGNVGAAARAMANFGLDRLVVVNPKCDFHGKEAMDRAVHAKEILKKAKVSDMSALYSFDYLIATTGIIGTDFNLPRSPLSARQLGKKLSGVRGRKIGILFGNEGIGLRNDEIRKCDFIVTIPTSPEYPVMNLSHAAAIVFYELFQASRAGKTGDHILPAGAKDKEAFFAELEIALDKMHFTTKEKKETQRTVWKRMIGKAMLTKRELFALFGFLRKMG